MMSLQGKVLILVVVEFDLTFFTVKKKDFAILVLILVVVEFDLTNRFVSIIGTDTCLNPCCSGI